MNLITYTTTRNYFLPGNSFFDSLMVVVVVVVSSGDPMFGGFLRLYDPYPAEY